jgi:ubiquinone/menaquinone biosynthesis C-methylase UbiE
MKHPELQSDEWSEWLLHRRHADDPEYGRFVQSAVRVYADRVLDGAELAAGMTLLDVGSGEGLVAFRAVERAGAALRVILTDISLPMLRHSEALAVQLNVRAQCTFIECSAESLEGVGDSSVDAVTSRAALAYVGNKKAAFAEIHRVLKPGGRLSIAEPVLQDDAFFAAALRRRVEDRKTPSADPFLPLLHRWKAAQFPDTEEARATSPIANYSERDLVNMAKQAGFCEIHLQLHIDVMPSQITDWQVFLGTSPHPWAPPLQQILAERFTSEERRLFERLVRPAVESGTNIGTERSAYLQARKPAPA